MPQCNIRQCNITVYNYRNDHGAPFKMTVTAQCVGGDEGVFAVFTMPKHPDLIGMAWGDDGHWQLADVINKYRIDGIIEAFKAEKVINNENKTE